MISNPDGDLIDKASALLGKRGPDALADRDRAEEDFPTLTEVVESGWAPPDKDARELSVNPSPSSSGNSAASRPVYQENPSGPDTRQVPPCEIDELAERIEQLLIAHLNTSKSPLRVTIEMLVRQILADVGRLDRQDRRD